LRSFHPGDFTDIKVPIDLELQPAYIGDLAVKNTRDIASEALTEIADMWKVDHARSIPTDNGFDWWPGDYKVSVTAIRRTDGYVPETWMLSVKTDFLKEVPVDSDRFVRWASLTSGAFGSTHAWVFPPAEFWNHHGPAGTKPHLWFANTAYLTSENAWWLPGFLARMSILQPINARSAVVMPKTLGGGVPDVSRSALLGRSRQENVLDETMAAYVAIGSSPNRWAGTDEFMTIADEWNGLDRCVCRGDGGGFRLDMDVGEQPARIELSTNEKHPQLGNGLRGSLMLPILDDTKNIAERCAALNLNETMWTDIPQFGCWYAFCFPDDAACLKFSSFIPNALYGNGIASLMVLWLYQRIRWVMYGEYPTKVG
jgi:hypothetical protein